LAKPPQEDEITQDVNVGKASAPDPVLPESPVASGPVKMDLRYLIRALVKHGASDLHLKVGRPPLYRINGSIAPLKVPPLSEAQINAIVQTVLSPHEMKVLEEKRHFNISFLAEDLGRFRCHVFYSLGMRCAAIRMIPLQVPAIENLGIPRVLKDVCHRPRGLFLVTGASGMGKSTTLAAMVHCINQESYVHVLTIEDPIEFMHRDIKASITQREVGTDTLSFQDALVAGLRQDPDVIVIGELLDRETIQTALTAAETGHLVIATLHTNSALSTIQRILDVFPREAQDQIRAQLASSLIGVISQQLIHRAKGKGMVPACEMMIKTPAIEEFLRNNQMDQLAHVISTGSGDQKVQTMNQAILKLIQSGTIRLEEGLRASNSPENLKLALSGVSREEGYDAGIKIGSSGTGGRAA